MRKSITPEKLFVDNLSYLIKNLFLDNKNFSNNYYHRQTKDELLKDVQDSARYILGEIERTKHLVDPEFE